MDWGKLFSFDGRVSRQPFWLTSLLLLVPLFVAALLTQADNAIALIIGIIVYIPVVVASLANQIKRWHDRDKSGWWVLITLVPIIGGIWALIENGFLSGTPGPNKYGPQNGGSPMGS